MVAEPAESWSIDHGDGHRPDIDSDDAVLAAARAAVGERRPMALKVDNEIPIGRGMGSSAAALAAGAAAALAATGETIDHDHVFHLVAEMEGHPDNAAAAVYGGLVLIPAVGRPLRLPIHPGIRPVVAVPKEIFLTAEARLALPDSVDREVAMRTAARVSALTAGFVTGDAAMFAHAGGDEIHEGPRSRRHPATAEMVGRARDAGAFHAAWSGSGPSVVAFVDRGSQDRVVATLTGPDTRVLVLDVATRGLDISA